MHFPGISLEAGEFLIKERDIAGVGVDVISFDPGWDRQYRTHRAILGASKWAIEAVANLGQIPPSGATVFVGATKVGGATGGPVRLIAVWRGLKAKTFKRQKNGGQKNVYPALSQTPRHAVRGSLLQVRIALMIPNAIFLSLIFLSLLLFKPT